MIRRHRLALLAAAVAFVPFSAQADTAQVAVAANFTEAAKEIAAAFAQSGEHTVELSFGSTGSLYNQIGQGAPFQAFLAADDARPDRALEEGLAVEGTDFTYAIGQLALYSTSADLADGPNTLETGDFETLAIANPETAPYGAAAVETMENLGVYETLQPKLVMGQNIAQAYQFVETGNAPLGFVALSQIAQSEDGSRWLVPANMHEPIRQNAVLLTTGEDSAAAKAFLEFLQGPEAAEIIESYGYATDG